MRILIAILLVFTTILNAQDVHEGDYYVTGADVEINMLVKGDVFAGGSKIYVRGRVEGDVIAAGGTIQIDGDVLGNVRATGGEVIVNGTIHKNLTVFSGSLLLNKGSLIRGNVYFVGGEAKLGGEIRGEVTLKSSVAEINGEINGRLKVGTGDLQIGPQSDIDDLEYSSGHEVKLDPGAKVDGQIIYNQSQWKKFGGAQWKQKLIVGSKVLAISMNLLFSFVAGVLYIKLFPRSFHGALRELKKKPWAAVGMGLLMLILLPIISLLLLVSILGFPIGLAVIAFSLLTFYTAKVLPIVWIMHRIFPKMNLYLALFLGLIGFFILVQVPIFGGILSFAFILLGHGAVTLSRGDQKSA